MPMTRKTPMGAMLGATALGAVAAGFVAWQLHLNVMSSRIEQIQGTLKKLTIAGQVPPNQEVLDYMASRGEALNKQRERWERKAIAPVPIEASSSDPQLYFQERLHDIQRSLEKLAAARGLGAPEALGFPKELPPSDTVPRLLVQLTLIEDVAKLILAHEVDAVSSFKVEDPQPVAVEESEDPFVVRLPVRVRLAARLPIMLSILGALQKAQPLIELHALRLSSEPDGEALEVELALARYLMPAALSPAFSDSDEAGEE